MELLCWYCGFEGVFMWENFFCLDSSRNWGASFMSSSLREKEDCESALELSSFGCCSVIEGVML